MVPHLSREPNVSAYCVGDWAPRAIVWIMQYHLRIALQSNEIRLKRLNVTAQPVRKCVYQLVFLLDSSPGPTLLRHQDRALRIEFGCGDCG